MNKFVFASIIKEILNECVKETFIYTILRFAYYFMREYKLYKWHNLDDFYNDVTDDSFFFFLMSK